MKPFYEDYTKQSKTFKRNVLSPLDDEMKQVVYEEWKEAFEYFGYQK